MKYIRSATSATTPATMKPMKMCTPFSRRNRRAFHFREWECIAKTVVETARAATSFAQFAARTGFFERRPFSSSLSQCLAICPEMRPAPGARERILGSARYRAAFPFRRRLAGRSAKGLIWCGTSCSLPRGICLALNSPSFGDGEHHNINPTARPVSRELAACGDALGHSCNGMPAVGSRVSALRTGQYSGSNPHQNAEC